VSPTTLAGLRLLHFIGFTLAVGGGFAAQRVIGLAREHSAAQRAGIEIAAKRIIIMVELIGLMVALAAGIALLAQNPNHLIPSASGAGPWLHIKLVLVAIVLVIAHLRMFRLARLVRERDAGASEAECEALLTKAARLGQLDLALYALIFFVAIFRYALFTNG